MKPKLDYTLYLVTDRRLLHSSDLEKAVEKAISGGCTLVQLREKSASSIEFYNIANAVKQITNRYHVPLIINDRLDIALAVDAAGVHVGQADLPAKMARTIIGESKILGVSVSSLQEAVKAQAEGADYLGVGAMFATGTKTNAALATMDELRKIQKAIILPIVVIGGINYSTVLKFQGIGIDGIAVVSAVLSQPDICMAARRLKALLTENIISGVDLF